MGACPGRSRDFDDPVSHEPTDLVITSFAIRIAELVDDFEAHLAGGAGDDAEAGFLGARVQVFALGVHDVDDLFARHFADFCFVRFF